MKRLNVKIQTHGCKLNIADSQSIAKSFYAAGHTISPDNENNTDVFILNSCTVTHVADSKARQAIRRAKRLLRLSQNINLNTALEMAASQQSLLQMTNDHKEAIQALIEKRKPEYKNS